MISETTRCIALTLLISASPFLFPNDQITPFVLLPEGMVLLSLDNLFSGVMMVYVGKSAVRVVDELRRMVRKACEGHALSRHLFTC